MPRKRPSGRWTVQEFARLDGEIKTLNVAASKKDFAEARIDLAAIEDLDTAGAWLLHDLHKQFEAAGVKASVQSGSERQRILLGVVDDNIAALKPARLRRNPIMPIAGETAAAMFSAIENLVRLTAFRGEITVCAARTAVRPWRFRCTAFIHHIEHTGLRAVPIISLICLLIGGVITQQGVLQLRNFGAEPFAVDMVGVLTLREVGILLTAIMVAGRSASATRTLGISPIETLVLPRIAALIIGLVGCLEGLSVQGSAESLGTHVTNSVVKAIFLVIIFDALFAMLLSASSY